MTKYMFVVAFPFIPHHIHLQITVLNLFFAWQKLFFIVIFYSIQQIACLCVLNFVIAHTYSCERCALNEIKSIRNSINKPH